MNDGSSTKPTVQMDTAPTQELIDTLLPFGARQSDVVLLDAGKAKPAQYVRYLDIARHSSREKAPWPCAVVEVDGQPVLYVVNNLAQAPIREPHLARLRRALAFRASADHVAFVEPGLLTIYPVAPVKKSPPPRRIARQDLQAPGSIPSLAFPEFSRKRVSSTSAAVQKLLYDLLTTTTNKLICPEVDHLAALSLAGRALFARFLLDREVLLEEDVRTICSAGSGDCFASARSAALMSAWLDRTFNGDFLPLPERGTAAWFQRLPAVVFHQLTNIMCRATSTGQLHLEWGDKWSDLLFDHIPVGLLSQVYEQHAHLHDATRARAQSVHYTPHYVADYMVREVFDALGPQAARARVLDPSVGGGVFLVTAFRSLVAARWKASKKKQRPDTPILRQILYKQLTGFDINESALRLCSLGLYLTAIELDPRPRPLERLRFDEPLLGTVLHDVRAREERHTYLGSLGQDRVGAAHRGRYDVVIGNPPWTPWRVTKQVTEEDLEEQISLVKAAVTPIVRARLGQQEAKSYEMTARAPDLPFLWRSLEWAKPGGLIALVLHGRLLFKQSGPGAQARNHLFRAIQLTGVLNGAAIRDTNFWPRGLTKETKAKRMRAPFCLLFARNERRREDAGFLFVSPELEETLNNLGRLRIDSQSAEPVLPAIMEEQPALLKTLFRGTSLDVGVMDCIRQQAPVTLGEYWSQHGYKSGEGFKLTGKSPPSARELVDKPELSGRRPAELPYILDAHFLDASLPKFKHKRVSRPRDPEQYEAPLVIVHAASQVREGRGTSARLALGKVVYSNSFHGYSCARAPEPELLARYLLLLLNSRIVLYFALLSSSRFGVERDAFLLEDLERFPFLPLEEVPERWRREIRPLSELLNQGPQRAREKIDTWVEAVYGLSRWDREVIRDTLEVALPLASSRAHAQKRPGIEELEAFRQRLEEVVQPFLEGHPRRLSTRILINDPTVPWIVIQVDSHVVTEPVRLVPEGRAIEQLLATADSLGSSQVRVLRPPSTLLIGIVAQYRYFTPSRGRLLALSLLDEHRAILLGKVAHS